MCTITENHPFNHSIHSGAEEIKIDMLIKRFTLDRKQPSDRCYKLKVLYSIIFNLLKMNNPSLHIKSFFSRGSISFMSKRIHSFIMLQFYRQWWSFISLSQRSHQLLIPPLTQRTYHVFQQKLLYTKNGNQHSLQMATS